LFEYFFRSLFEPMLERLKHFKAQVKIHKSIPFSTYIFTYLLFYFVAVALGHVAHIWTVAVGKTTHKGRKCANGCVRKSDESVLAVNQSQ